MENDATDGIIVNEKDQMKRYYVDFYDMFDGWGGFGFYTERLFDDLPDAKKLCDKLNVELEEGNKKCGEHYGVIDSAVNREVYCGQDENYRKKLFSDLKGLLLELGVSTQDEKKSELSEQKVEQKSELSEQKVEQKSDESDKYQEVAEEIAYVIKDDLFDSSHFDIDQVVDILKRRFNVDNENMGKLLMSDVTVFNTNYGDLYTIPLFGVAIFVDLGAMPIISGKNYPNYDIRNKYMGYTENGVFHRVTGFGILMNYIKKNPTRVMIAILAGYIVAIIIMFINGMFIW